MTLLTSRAAASNPSANTAEPWGAVLSASVLLTTFGPVCAGGTSQPMPPPVLARLLVMMLFVISASDPLSREIPPPIPLSATLPRMTFPVTVG